MGVEELSALEVEAKSKKEALLTLKLERKRYQAGQSLECSCSCIPSWKNLQSISHLASKANKDKHDAYIRLLRSSIETDLIYTSSLSLFEELDGLSNTPMNQDLDLHMYKARSDVSLSFGGSASLLPNEASTNVSPSGFNFPSFFRPTKLVKRSQPFSLEVLSWSQRQKWHSWTRVTFSGARWEIVARYGLESRIKVSDWDLFQISLSLSLFTSLQKWVERRSTFKE